MAEFLSAEKIPGLGPLIEKISDSVSGNDPTSLRQDRGWTH